MTVIRRVLFQSLALCTACVLYLLARDRLSVAIDKTTLSLLIAMMETEEPTVMSAEYSKYRCQVWEVLEKWKNQVQSVSSDNESFVFDVTEENLSVSLGVVRQIVQSFIDLIGHSFIDFMTWNSV